ADRRAGRRARPGARRKENAAALPEVREGRLACFSASFLLRCFSSLLLRFRPAFSASSGRSPPPASVLRFRRAGARRSLLRLPAGFVTARGRLPAPFRRRPLALR